MRCIEKMQLKNVVPWGRNLEEYQKMFFLSDEGCRIKKILGCGDGPASFNAEVTKMDGNIVSVDPIYQFSKKQIQQRIDETSSLIAQELKNNQDNFVWKNINNVDELIDTRLQAMQIFLNDYEKGLKEDRYQYQQLPKLDFENDSFDIVLSSHLLFLYSDHLDFHFHKDSILEMCRVSKDIVKIFPLIDLQNKRSKHLEPIIKLLDEQGYKVNIISTDYEFQKGGNETLEISIRS